MFPYIYEDTRVFWRTQISTGGSFPGVGADNGLGQLTDAISCIVTEEKNGQFELELKYPINGIHSEYIKPFAIIYAKTRNTDDEKAEQPFFIYKIGKSIDGIMTINAYHTTYLMKYMVLEGDTTQPTTTKHETLIEVHEDVSKFGQAITNKGRTNGAYYTPLNVNGDIFTTYAYSKIDRSVPRTVREVIGGAEGSLIDRYHCETYPTMGIINVTQNRGSNNGVVIEYRKNMIGMTFEVDYSGVYTSCKPYWKKDDVCISLPRYVSTSGATVDGCIAQTAHVGDYVYNLCVPLDLSDEFEEEPTQAQLKSRAIAIMNERKTWEPSVSMTVNFQDLSRVQEYPIKETVGLCDIVRVIHREIGVDVLAEVVSIVYDVLNETYTSLEIGNKQLRYADVIKGA